MVKYVLIQHAYVRKYNDVKICPDITGLYVKICPDITGLCEKI